jgi:katanin p60 ATPase-containing subunit A1
LDFDFIVKKTEGFSGADITNVCREAAYMPMRRKLKNEGGFKNITDLKKFEEEVSVPLKKEDFIEALKSVNKSVGKEDLHKYDNWMKEFGTV